MSRLEKFSWGCARVSRVGDAPLMRGFSPPPTADLRSAFLCLISTRIVALSTVHIIHSAPGMALRRHLLTVLI
jgi:hypothetical protein